MEEELAEEGCGVWGLEEVILRLRKGIA